MIFLRQIGFILLFSLPVAAVVFTIWRERKRESLRSLLPFDELQRRPAGESTRLVTEKLGEEIDVWLMTLVFIPVLFSIALLFQPKIGYAQVAIFFVAAAIVAAIVQSRLRPLFNKFKKYRLGFQGERYVAEEVNLLMMEGCRVFHDVPFDTFNMDHVIVGPTGVFVVETKTKRKPVIEGAKKYEVVFDGTALQFPHGRDTSAIEQVTRNTKTLQRWLSSATADSVKVHGIVTIPGWWVTRTARSDFSVLNPKEIRSAVVANRGVSHSAAEIQRACHQLEQKCRLSLEVSS
jgi:Nuclease-related domain